MTIEHLKIPSQTPGRLALLLLAMVLFACNVKANPTAGDASAVPVTDAGTTDAATTPDAAACPDRAERLRFGLNVDPDNPNGNPGANTLRALGVRWVRIEWKHYANDAERDATIAALRAGGIRVLLIVDYASITVGTPGTDGSAAAWNVYVDDHFLPRIAELAQRYGDAVDAWEIWNEPDLRAQPGYDPYVPPEIYGRMLAGSFTAIRAHSTRPVLVGGLASGNPGYLELARDAVGQLAADGVAIHPYGQRAPDNWPSPTWGFGDLSALIDAYWTRFEKPVWITEIGTVDAVNQAQYLRNVYDVAAAHGPRVPVVLWFCYSDAMVAPFGLLDSSGAPKPSFAFYGAAAPDWDKTCDGL